MKLKLNRIFTSFDISKFLNFYKYPNYLYRYFSFDSKNYFEDILCKDLLHFSSPKELNDPFDCSLNIIFSGRNKRFMKKYLIKKILPIRINNISKDLIRKASAFIDENYQGFDPNIKSNELLLQQNNRNYVLSSGVNCLSELNNNLLMWSHYSNKHTGFCVEFNCDKLVKAIDDYNKSHQVITYLNKIVYKRNYPRISAYKHEMVDSLFTKSSIWMYEKEWRIVYSEGAGQKINLPPNVITAIYMGLEIQPTQEEIIKRIVLEKQYKIDLYRAKKVPNKFAVCFDKIN